MAPPRPPLPPAIVASLLALAVGHAHAVPLFAKLGLPDLLAAPRSLADLAEATGTRPDALERLLGFCTCLGLVYDRGATFELTETGRTLVNDTATARGLGLYLAGWQNLEAMLRGGAGPAADPGLSELRRGRVAAHHALALSEYAAGFKRSETYVDVGSGDAALLEGILKASGRSEGIYVGREAELARIEAALKTAGVAHRCEFLTPAATLPAGDAFVLADRIEELGDDAAATLLGRCRAAMRPNGRVLLIGPLLRNQFTERLRDAALVDLEMLLFTPSGRAREEEELRALCTRAGLSPRTFLRAQTADVLEAAAA